VSRLLLVCVGGAVGSGARYLVALWAAAALPLGYPVGTTIVNVVGSWFLGVVMDLSLRLNVIGPNLQIFLATGVAGGFTTYSTFNWETLRLVEERSYGLAATYVLGTLLACGAAGLLGVATSRLVASALEGFITRG
jgi:CrcB protein